jgi:hypothetical protein
MLTRSTLLAIVVAAGLFAVAPVNAIPSSCAAPVDPASFASRGSQIVSGFLAQRLYLHSQHPDACNACKAAAYIVSGDRVSVGDVCGTWTAVKFRGKSREYYGWVQSDRLVNVSDSGPLDSTSKRVVYSPLKSLRPEKTSFAADAGLCDAVRLGKIEDVGLDEITPISVDGNAFGSITSEIEGALLFEFFRRGSVDIDNDGRVELVAMARSSGPPLGQGTTDYVWEWPVVLNQKGLPDVQANLNEQAVKAGNEMARLIRYQGRIYVESRSLERQPDSHRVSEISAQGLKTMCSFSPGSMSAK